MTIYRAVVDRVEVNGRGPNGERRDRVSIRIYTDDRGQADIRAITTGDTIRYPGTEVSEGRTVRVLAVTAVDDTNVILSVRDLATGQTGRVRIRYSTK